MMHSVVRHARRIVVKVGSSLVTAEGGGLDHAALSRWAEQIAALAEQRQGGRAGVVRRDRRRHRAARLEKAAEGPERAAGRRRRRPDGLVQAYESCFRTHGLHAAQVLLTHEDLTDRTRYLNARTTLRTLLQLRSVPIINENDTVATDEIRLGDNDTLGALVTNLIEADCLIILTDQPGLYTADPRKDPQATLVLDARRRPRTRGMAGGAGSSVGTGGMLTKILAAKRAARSGAHTVICSGREENVLLRLAAGEAIGSQLVARQAPLAARRQWLADHLQLRGGVVLDAGAVRALTEEGKSLLPVGVKGPPANSSAAKWWRWSMARAAKSHAA
jgi:glutamate 5-kinase